MTSKVVELEEKDEDGYWIYLRKGYQCGDNPGCHTIIENTKREAKSHLVNVVKCFCAQCEGGCD